MVDTPGHADFGGEVSDVVESLGTAYQYEYDAFLEFSKLLLLIYGIDV